MTYLLLHADARHLPLADESVQCVVTSPPYWNLRDYGVDGQLGLERTPEEYVANMVEVFREVRRVMRADGTLWLNLGDSYAANRSYQVTDNKHVDVGNNGGMSVPPGLKPKDLVGIPWRVAFALQADGWYLRSDIIWHKPNPMPESVTDRPTSAHEYVFLLAKSGKTQFWTHRDGRGARSEPTPDYRWLDNRSSDRGNARTETAIEPTGWRDEVYEDEDGRERKRWSRINLWSASGYYYDADAIREPHARLWDESNGGSWSYGKGDAERVAERGKAGTHSGEYPLPNPAGRNKRTVWTVATRPYSGAHFATFPEALVEPCILAGSAPKACGVCGAPWARVAERTPAAVLAPNSGYGDGAGRNDGGRSMLVGASSSTLGWQPTCEHDDDTGKSIVLDPFNGSGTTGRVALRHGRAYVGTDVNRAYLEEQALARLDPLAAQKRDVERDGLGQPTLF